MAVREYIGARYVPRFMGTYDPTQIYDALDVVDNGSGTSYIARKTVPAGTSLTDPEYWFVYGASSGAIIQIQNDLQAVQNDITNNIKPDITQNSNDIAALGNDINDLEDYVRLNGRRVVTISDSYGRTTPTGTSWELELESLIGGDFYNYYAGSMGIYNPGDGGYTALSLLQAHALDITDHDTITDIVFGLGVNDINNATKAQLESAYDSLIAYCQTTYPNARVWFGFISWGPAFVQSATYIDFINVMKSKCAEYKCHYMEGVEYIAHDMTLKQNDGLHPSADGSKVIAKGIAAIMNGQSYTYQNIVSGTLTPTTGTAVGYYMGIDGPISYFRVPNVYNSSAFTFVGTNYYDFGTLDHPMFINGVDAVLDTIFSNDANAPETMNILLNNNKVKINWPGSGSRTVNGVQLNTCILKYSTLLV